MGEKGSGEECSGKDDEGHLWNLWMSKKQEEGERRLWLANGMLASLKVVQNSAKGRNKGMKVKALARGFG